MARSMKPGIGDIVVGVTGLSVAGWAYACSKGYALTASVIFGGIVSFAYAKAPSRTFPTSEKVTEDVDLTGKVAVVTGATNGIGVETARVLALRGARVYIAGRNESKLEVTQKELILKLPAGAEIIPIVCDLSDLQSVRHGAKHILASEDKIDILINNAGIMAVPTRTETRQGLESQVGICHVGHFYLTKLLLPSVRAARGRIVCVSSVAHRYHDLESMLSSPMLDTDPYDGWKAYGNAKCCNILHAKAISEKFQEDGVTAYSVMPGGIHTGLQGHVDWYRLLQWYIVTPFVFKSIEQGAATTMVCATSNDPSLVQNGEYHDNCAPFPRALAKVSDEIGTDAPDRLWKLTEKILKDLGFD